MENSKEYTLKAITANDLEEALESLEKQNKVESSYMVYTSQAEYNSFQRILKMHDLKDLLRKL